MKRHTLGCVFLRTSWHALSFSTAYRRFTCALSGLGRASRVLLVAVCRLSNASEDAKNTEEARKKSGNPILRTPEAQTASAQPMPEKAVLTSQCQDESFWCTKCLPNFTHKRFRNWSAHRKLAVTVAGPSGCLSHGFWKSVLG